MTAMREIKPLTSLRFVAALLVFAVHYAGLFGKAANVFEAVVIEGQIGVTLFFLLSGFLITLRYFATPETTPWRPGQYLFKRIARIWPLYFFLFFVALYFRNEALFSVNTLFHVTFTHGYFMKYWQRVIPTAWSLTVEESFYLLAPVIFLVFWWLCRRSIFKRHHPLLVLGGLLIALTLIMALVGTLLQRLSIATGFVDVWGFMGGYDIGGSGTIQYATIFFRIFDFGVGMWCAMFYVHYLRDGFWQRPSSRWTATVLFVASVCGIALLEYGMNQFGGNFNRKGQLFNYPIVVVAGLLILSLTRAETLPYRVMSMRLLVYLGRVSYGLYLLQGIVPLFNVIRSVATGVGIHVPGTASGTGFYPVWFFSLYLLLTVIAIVLYEVVEKNGARLVMSIYDRWQRRPRLQRSTSLAE